MDEDLEFTLEDILKEFGSGTPASPEPEEEPVVPEVPEEEPAVPEVPEEEPAVPEVPEEEPAVMDAPEEEPVKVFTPKVPDTPAAEGADLEATRTFAPVQDASQTRSFPPLGDTQRIELPPQEPEKPQEPEPEQEPFTGQWEPEYEEPMGEYVPPEPIPFRPRPTLRDLKRKLVAGPEKRYYDLSELGLGRLQLAIACSFLVTVLVGVSLLLDSWGLVDPARMRLLVYGQVLAMLVSALLGCYQLMDGVSSLFHGRFTPNTLLVFMFLLSIADGIMGLQALRLPFCGTFSMEVTMALTAAYHRRYTELGQMDTLRKATRLDAVVRSGDLYEGRAGFLRGDGDVDDFMDQYTLPSGPEKAMNIFCLVVLLVSAALGVAVGVLQGVTAGVHAATACLMAGLPASAFVCCSRPTALLEKLLHKFGAVLCGWRGVLGMCGPACVPVGDKDLFPDGSVKLNGVKFFGTREPDQVVEYATALITAEGGGLSPVFEQLLDSRNGRHFDVEHLRSYASGGLGGEVQGEPVLLGALPFMQEMGVDMPSGTRVSQAVYAAIDGELCGVFAITYEKVPASAAGLSILCGYPRLMPVLVSGDFVLTESFLRSKFNVNTRRMEFPERSARYALAQKQPGEDDPVLALTTREGLAPMAYAIAGGRALRNTCRVGAVLHILAGIVGMACVAVLAILKTSELFSPVNLLLFQLVWMVPGLLATEWTKTL